MALRASKEEQSTGDLDRGWRFGLNVGPPSQIGRMVTVQMPVAFLIGIFHFRVMGLACGSFVLCGQPPPKVTCSFGLLSPDELNLPLPSHPSPAATSSQQAVRSW